MNYPVRENAALPSFSSSSLFLICVSLVFLQKLWCSICNFQSTFNAYFYDFILTWTLWVMLFFQVRGNGSFRFTQSQHGRASSALKMQYVYLNPGLLSKFCAFHIPCGWNSTVGLLYLRVQCLVGLTNCGWEILEKILHLYWTCTNFFLILFPKQYNYLHSITLY